MNFKISKENHFASVRSEVEKLDATNAAELKAELIELNKAGFNKLILDLGKTRYCDSSGLSAILTANRLCKDANGVFILCGLQESVSKMVSISQLDKVLSISTDFSEALSKINA